MRRAGELLEVDDARHRRDFEVFFDRVSRRLVGQAYLMTGSVAEAQDLAQETLLRVWTRWDRVSQYEEPEAFARRVLYNLAVSWRRRRRVAGRSASITASLPAPVLCAGPTYHPSPSGVFAIHVPCPAANTFTAADYVSGTGTYDPPGPWTSLSTYPSTTPAADRPGVPVMLTDPRDEYGHRLLLGPASATDSIIAGAAAHEAGRGNWVVDLSLTPAGVRLFDQVATRNYHVPLAFDLGGRLLSAPVILAKDFRNGIAVSGGSTGFTKPEADQLAVVLGNGAIPVPLRAVNVVG